MPYLWKMFEREAARSGTLDSYIEQLRMSAPPAQTEAPAPAH
jgi:hypothetical protein